MTLALILLAAGSGTRLGLNTPKALVPIAGRPIVRHVLDSLADPGMPSFVQVVITAPEHDQLIEQWASGLDMKVPISVISGGTEREDSVRKALAQLAQQGEPEHPVSHVIIHDAARALAPAEVFARVAKGLEAGYDAVVPALKVTDTIKQVQAASAAQQGGELVQATVARDSLRAVQTPQGFALEPLTRAHQQAAGPVTDDAMLMEQAGVPVLLVEGSAQAFKITTAFDLHVAEAVKGKQ